MSSPSVTCSYAYLSESRLDRDQLLLATSSSHDIETATSGSKDSVPAAPNFFSGQLTRPRRVAGLLRALMNIVRSRFHVPAAMLSRILLESDPVVTCSDNRLRFEGFSACCGAYARVDLLPDSVDGERFGRGTTNVDFNQPMLTALARIRESDQVTLHVGSEHVKLIRNADTVIEKQVQLPVRWLKGFVEVQVCQSRMLLVHDVDGREATRFLRSLPRMKTNRRETFVVAAGRGLRLSQISVPNAVRVGGLERLRVLEDICADADRLRIYSDETTGASAWELHFGDCRFCLVISPEVWRGFSGEGQAIREIASKSVEQILVSVRSQLAWTAVIDEEALHRRVASASTTPVDAAMIRSALSVLGTRGLVGFDLAEGCWFHRVLPFDLDQVEKQHPRLRDAQKLLVEDRVRIAKQTSEQVEAFVQASGVEHRVRLNLETAKCTCTWFAKHGASRGPCKHILATMILVENTDAGTGE